MATVFPLQIFFDGSCRVCASEMARYRADNPQQRLQFVDISAPEFEPARYGKTQAEFMARLHVRDAAGSFSTGIDAFMQIWQAYPSGSSCRLLGAFVGLPGINLLSRFGYQLFARNRHLLPQNRNRCSSESCQLHN